MPLQLSWITQPHRTQITRSDEKRKLNPSLKISIIGDNISEEYGDYQVECLLCAQKQDKAVVVTDGIDLSKKSEFIFF